MKIEIETTPAEADAFTDALLAGRQALTQEALKLKTKGFGNQADKLHEFVKHLKTISLAVHGALLWVQCDACLGEGSYEQVTFGNTRHSMSQPEHYAIVECDQCGGSKYVDDDADTTEGEGR